MRILFASWRLYTYSSNVGKASHRVPPRIAVLIIKRADIFKPALINTFRDARVASEVVGVTGTAP